MATPHDSLFHRIFSRPDNARALLRRALPPGLSAAIDWATLEPVGTEFINDSLKGRRADLLFTARLIRQPDRHVYLLVEHKSGRAARTAAQVQRYIGLVFQRHREVHPGTPPPAVIPLLVHHGPRPWQPERHRPQPSRLLAPFLEYAGILVFDLAGMDEAAVRELSLPPFAGLGLLCLHGLPRRTPPEAEAALRRWADLLAAVHAADPGEDCQAVSWYLLYVTGLTPERSAVLFAELLGPEAEEIPMSTGARIEREARRKGREEGREEGREAGREEGRAQLLLRQLAARFGPLAASVGDRVRAGSSADLERWAIAVLTASSLDEVLV